MRLRRRRSAAGGAVPVPIALGAYLWWDPSVNYTLDGSSNVSNFLDRIQGFDASQGTGTRRPAYNAASANMGGNPSMTYDSLALQALSTGTVTGLTNLPDLEVFITRYVAAAPASTQQIINADGGTSDFWLRVNTNPDDNIFSRDNASNVVGVSTGTAGAVGSHWVDAMVDATTLDVESSGAGAGSAAASGGVFNLDRFTMGSAQFDGELGDFIVFGRKLSAAERASMQAFLAGRI